MATTALRNDDDDPGSPGPDGSDKRIPVSSPFIDDLWSVIEPDRLGLTKSEFASALYAVGTKCNFGLSFDVRATPSQIEQFFRTLNLRDFALAQACALGYDPAWELFLARYRSPLTKFAIHITQSVSQGQELADSLYAELFGLSERNSQRKSPLSSYTGRGALLVWLRATLAQRHVAAYRRTKREEPLETETFEAPLAEALPTPDTLLRLQTALKNSLQDLAPEDRLLLSFYFLDQAKLGQIGQLMGVHESTVSRRLSRLTDRLHHQLLKNLQDSSLSARAAREALGTDPRDVEINLRKILQSSDSSAFLVQEDSSRSRTS